MTFIVTVKIIRQPYYRERPKHAGLCPISNNECSDIGSEYHSFICMWDGIDIQGVIDYYSKEYYVDRVERIGE